LPTGPIEFKRLLFWNRRIDRAIREVNDCMISYCQENEIMVLDLYSSLLDKRGKTNNSCYKDFLHLNDDGYKIMNSCLEIFFQNEFLLKV
jgi:lysophospholipase L1-like esterase